MVLDTLGEVGGEGRVSRFAALRQAEVRPSLGVPPQLSADVYDAGIEVLLAEAERLTLAKAEADTDIHRDVVPVLEARPDGIHG
ncbi:hypothetical protein AB0D04_41810 [Streptomyces sp. NPDC048483]|uniref:hypothetical protein n=1 Tax=Streptomyces sp. NPDC048483 TaxID=3154927 RepID=UPI00341CA672